MPTRSPASFRETRSALPLKMICAPLVAAKPLGKRQHAETAALLLFDRNLISVARTRHLQDQGGSPAADDFWIGVLLNPLSSTPHKGGSQLLDFARSKKLIDQRWGDEIVPTLIDYIQDPQQIAVLRSGLGGARHMDEAVALFEHWARDKLPSFRAQRSTSSGCPGRTPVILIDIPGEGDDTVLLYGHLDKQPEMTGWAEGYGPWIPRLEGEQALRPRRRR